MDTPSTIIQELARELLALEAANRAGSDSPAAEIVCAKLSASLTRFAGVDGFLALMRRSLALARREAASLSAVRLKPDGCFEGFDALAQSDTDEAAASLIANFLWLLVTFVGEPLALRLVREVWPELKVESMGAVKV